MFENEAQFFGFTPPSLADSLILAVNNIFFEVIRSLYKTLKKKGYPPEKLTRV
jgi:hypothetical protein